MVLDLIPAQYANVETSRKSHKNKSEGSEIRNRSYTFQVLRRVAEFGSRFGLDTLPLKTFEITLRKYISHISQLFIFAFCGLFIVLFSAQ